MFVNWIGYLLFIGALVSAVVAILFFPPLAILSMAFSFAAVFYERPY